MNAISRHTLEDPALPMFGMQNRGIDVTQGNPFRAGLRGLGCSSCGDPSALSPGPLPHYTPQEFGITSPKLSGLGRLGYMDDLTTPGQPSQGVVDFLSVFNGVANSVNKAITTITGQSAQEHAQENAVAIAAYQAQQAQAVAAAQAQQAYATAQSYWPLAIGGIAVLGVAALLLRK